MKTKTMVVIGALWFIASLLFLLLSPDKEELPKIEPLTKSWEKIVPTQNVPEGLVSLSAESCGMCHEDHYAEWKTSTHANAWTDMQFQAELKKETSPFFCINCHVPLQNQQEYIIDGMIGGDMYNPHKRKNTRFDHKLQQEGINCASCHVRDGAIIGPTGTDKAPHKTRKDPKFLSETLCIGCHNAVAVVTPQLACSFETGDEWKQGPYYGEKNCISCHMEETERSIVAGYEPRTSHRHFFSGSGIPKHDSLKTTMLNGLEFYPGELKSSYNKGEAVQFKFKVVNEHAGHRVPTGDPERFILFTFKVKDANGKTVAEQIERIGEKWEWYPKARKIGDNNLNPKERRSYFFEKKGLPSGSYTLEVEVTKHRMNEETAKYNKLPDSYPRQVTAYTKSIKFRVK